MLNVEAIADKRIHVFGVKIGALPASSTPCPPPIE